MVSPECLVARFLRQSHYDPEAFDLGVESHQLAESIKLHARIAIVGRARDVCTSGSTGQPCIELECCHGSEGIAEAR